MGLTVTSPAFLDGQKIPMQFTADGDDIAPPIEWSNVPDATKEFALVCDDPDAPTAQPWVHWVVYGIPADARSLPQGTLTRSVPSGIQEGVTSFGKTGYGGPAPPHGHGPHHYGFRVFALSAESDLHAGASKAELMGVVRGSLLAEGALTGVYER